MIDLPLQDVCLQLLSLAPYGVLSTLCTKFFFLSLVSKSHAPLWEKFECEELVCVCQHLCFVGPWRLLVVFVLFVSMVEGICCDVGIWQNIVLIEGL